MRQQKGRTPMAGKKTTEKSNTDDATVTIKRANIVRTTIEIRGTAPLVVNKFSKKQREKMKASMSASKAERGASRPAREPRDYKRDFEEARHRSKDGWDGVAASGLRAAMIDACRAAKVVMTQAKMAVFVIADGVDADDGTPLVRIYSDKEPEMAEHLVRPEKGGADIRIRPMWRQWSAKVTIEFDADMITADSVVNLLDRAGRQVGICEGRPYSKKSVGQGWGTFVVVVEAATLAEAAE